jgi:hypothetical protein
MAHYPAWANFVRGAKIQLWAAPAAEAPPAAVWLIEKNDYSAHRPLKQDVSEIRLVEVLPDRHDGPIRMVLRYTTLGDDRLRYDALSYCWGDAEDFQKVVLTGPDHPQPSEMFVNKNLFTALQQFRSSDVSRMLWIDLLCINQTDMRERTLQVALMGDIFAKADSVCVWLGESNHDLHKDWQVIGSISEKYQQILSGSHPKELAGVGKDCKAHPNMHFAHKTICSAPQDWTYDLSNDRVFQRPWFQRVWVLQEVWNAVHVRVFCGPDEYQWQAILQANRCFKKYGILNRNVLSWLWDALFTVRRNGTDLSCNRAPRIDILTILIAGHSMKATDPRDKIFAMMVFGNETHDMESLPQEVRPNYEKSILQVYADFTRWWILHHNSLRILSAVHTLCGRAWVNIMGPYDLDTGFDLSRRPSWILWHEGFSEWMHSTLALHEQCEYRAAGQQAIDHDLLKSTAIKEPDYLALKGVSVGTISSMAPYPFYEDPPTTTRSMHDAFIRLFDPSGTIGTWNSFNIRRSVVESIDMADHGQKSREWADHYISHWKTMPTSGKPTWLPCLENCMFTTREGGIGLCPSGTRVGDLVVLLFGGNVPYLLRPNIMTSVNESHESVDLKEYHFVGECYFEGVMKGEAFSSNLTSNVEVEVEVFLLV